MIFFSIANLVYPNLYLLCGGMWPDVKEALSGCCKKKEEEDDESESREVRGREYLEQKRQDLIKKYDLKLKE